MKDIVHIMQLFNRMVDAGNSVYLVEHNTDIIRSADYLIELGPAAGEAGGRLIFSGTPSEMLRSTHSVTANYIK